MLLIEKPTSVIKQNRDIYITFNGYSMVVTDEGSGEPYVWLADGKRTIWQVNSRPPTPWEVFKPRFIGFLKIFGSVLSIMGTIVWALLYVCFQQVFVCGVALSMVAISGIGIGLYVDSESKPQPSGR